jgi:hypothetical protein
VNVIIPDACHALKDDQWLVAKDEIDSIIRRIGDRVHSGNPTWRHCWEQVYLHLQVLSDLMELEERRNDV